MLRVGCTVGVVDDGTLIGPDLGMSYGQLPKRLVGSPFGRR